MSRTYDDIMNLPHHTSPVRKKMSGKERAAQFAPFAALTGYDIAIRETAHMAEQRMEHEYEDEELDKKWEFLTD